MSIAQSMLPEFDQEMANTRRVLERVPLDKASYKPHAKSTALGRLASHVATLPSFGYRIVELPELDFFPPGSQPTKQPEYTTTAEILEAFDDNIKLTRRALDGASDEAMLQPWSLKRQGRVIFSMPRVAMLRTLMLSHIIHHRAQLTVYLRLNDVPVPGMYGPSADEI